MKAAAVSGLSAQMSIGDAARRIVAVRSAELFAFMPAALDAHNVVALHDMRIAAKRLRYVLELVGFTLGEVAGEAESRSRELQTVIGAIHDHDVLLARLDSLERPAGGRGSRRLARHLRSSREELFGEFAGLWGAIEQSGLRERIVAATGASPNGRALGA